MNYLYTVLVIVAIVHGTASRGILGDPVITIINGTVYCDSFKCPSSAVKCHVNRHYNEANTEFVTKSRKCVNSYGTIVATEISEQSNIYRRPLNYNIAAEVIDRPLNPKEQIIYEQTLSANNVNV